MSTTLLDITAVRARFTALQRRLAFFDGPGGTQCPDEVIDAIAGYLRHDNANVGAPYETSRRSSALVDLAHEKAGSFLGCSGDEVAFGQSMTVAQLPAHARARARAAGGRRGARDEARPRRERRAVARAAGGPRHRRPAGRRARRPLARLRQPRLAAHRPDARRRLPGRRQLGRHRARRPADRRPRARRRRARLGRRRPLRPARADRRRRLGRRRAPLLAVQVLRATHGAGVREAGAARVVAPVQGAPGREPPRRAPLRARHLPARAARRLRRRGRLHRLDRLGRRSSRTSARSGSGSSTACPTASSSTACRRWRGGCRRSASTSPAAAPEEVATHLADEHEIAVWWGNYYALETIRQLGLDDEMGAVRAGIVHYNTEDEVDRLLAGVAELL